MHGGTYNTHPVVMAAANATLAYLERERDHVYSHLRAMGERLSEGFAAICERQGQPVPVSNVGPVVQLSFTSQQVFYDYRDSLDRDTDVFRRFQAALAARGVRATARGAFYISTAHSEADIEETLDRAEAALRAVV